MKLFSKILTLTAIVSLMAVCVFGQTTTFDTALTQGWNTFQHGELTNVVFVGGAIESGHHWGGLGALAYNLPKANALPLHPYLTPLFGVWEFGNSWSGFSGSLSLKTDLHPLRVFASTNTTGFFYKFTVTPNGVAGVLTTLSGEQFGTFKVPGNGTPGQTEALTGYGAAVSVADIKGWHILLAYEAVDAGRHYNTFDGGFRRYF